MSSQFDMNQPPRICEICTQVHTISTPCKFDVLVKRIHTLNHNIFSLINANREAVDTATAFQKLIKEMTPNAERWSAIEQEYRALVTSLKGAQVYPFAPSTDPNKPTPLVGVSVDWINELLPPDLLDSVEFERWLESRYKLKAEDHACNTGDCPHEKQAECDEALKKDFPDGATKDGEVPQN